MTDLCAQALEPQCAAATEIADLLAGSAPITRALVNHAMTTAYKGTDAQGRWTQRESFEILELATVKFLRAQDQTGQSPDRVDPHA